MAIAVALALLAAASVLFHFWSPWQATPLASNWGAIDLTLTITLLVTGLFFVLIIAFLAYAVYRYRHRHGNRAAYEPENKRLEWWLIVLTSVGIAAMLAPGLVVYEDFVHVPEDAHEVEVVGQQWSWQFRFPGVDGELGQSHVRHVSDRNPLGIDPADPRGQDDILVTRNEVMIPVDRPVKFLLRSKDVLHDFYVPQFRAKMDLVPGLVSYFWTTPTRIGRYEILCAELCGVGHYNMRGHVVVASADEYDSWLAQQPTFARSLTDAASGGIVRQGEQLARNSGCLACHSLDGTPGLGPSWLNLVGSSETLTDGRQVHVGYDYLRRSILAPAEAVAAGFQPVMAAYDFSEQQLDALIAYMASLWEIAPTE